MLKAHLAKFAYPFLILALSFVALKSLISVPFYTSHDGFTHTARIAAYYSALKDGQFPVQWATNLNGTLGSPIFVYSYPLVYMLGAGIHFLGVGYEETFRLIIGGGYILSGLAMYWWLKSRFPKFPAFIGTIFFLWTPYRFLDIYVRGALAESFAYIFLPLILLGIDKIFLDKSKSNWWWLLLTFSTVGMLLGHNVVSAMFLPVAVVWAGILFWTTKKTKPLILVLVGLFSAFLVSGFIYFPDLFERGNIRFDQGISYWQDHFVYLQQFIRSKWDYGFDLPGYVNDALSFELGLANWMALGLLAILLLIKRKTERFLVFWLLLFAVIVVIVIQSPISLFIWQHAPVMKTIIDFPWRWFGLLALVMGYIGAYLTKNTPKILALILLAAILIANRNHLWVNKSVTFGDAAYDQYTGTATATSNEYTPVWHVSSAFPQNPPGEESLNGNMKIDIGKTTADSQVFRVIAETPGEVRINRFYFPLTNIYKDGIKLEKGVDWEIIRQQSDKSSFDDSGTIKLKIAPPGGDYDLRLENTDLRRNANYLSILGLILIGGIFLVIKKT